MASSSNSMKDLEERWNNIQIEDEEEGILFEESEGICDEVDARWCLVGRLFLQHSVEE